MSSVQDRCHDENGIVHMNKATKLRRLPLSPLPRQGNVKVLSKNTSSNSTLKPNKSIVTSKIKKNSVKKLSENDGYLLENGSTHLSKGSTHDKESERLSSAESSSSGRAEESSCTQPSIFRQMMDFDDRDGTMVLKRANPIYDSDDDEDIEALPIKRQKTLEMTMALQWGERLQETSDGFSSMRLLRE